MDCGVTVHSNSFLWYQTYSFSRAAKRTGTISGPWVQLFEAECFSSETDSEMYGFSICNDLKMCSTQPPMQALMRSPPSTSLVRTDRKPPLQACKWDFTTGTYIQKNKQKITGLKSFRVTDWCAKYFYVMLGRAKHQKKPFHKKLFW